MPDTSKRPAVYNGKKTAEIFGCTPKTLRTWLATGRCPVDPIPGTKPPRWCAADVDAFDRGGDA